MALLVTPRQPEALDRCLGVPTGAADACCTGESLLGSYRTSTAQRAGLVRAGAQAWGRVVAFPYPPLTFLAEAPAFAAFGDKCASRVLAFDDVGAAWLIARTAPGKLGELAAALGALPAPHAYCVVEQAWTESLVLSASRSRSTRSCVARTGPSPALPSECSRPASNMRSSSWSPWPCRCPPPCLWSPRQS